MMMRAVLLLLICCLLLPAARAQHSSRIDLAQPAVPLPAAPRWSPDIATKGLGFFCRQELRMDKQTPLPVRVRLGSQQQADWLEGKPNVQRPDR